jgi:hypothetical protein
MGSTWAARRLVPPQFVVEWPSLPRVPDSLVEVAQIERVGLEGVVHAEGDRRECERIDGHEQQHEATRLLAGAGMRSVLTRF